MNKKMYEKIDDFLSEILPPFVWNILYELKPSLIKRRIVFFFQRQFRGFDDSETWDLDYTFFTWLLPRLKRFVQIACAYDMNYDNIEEWRVMMNQRVFQLQQIVDYRSCSEEFPDLIYLTEEEKKNIEKDCRQNMVAYDNCKKDFMKWYTEYLPHLWW